MNSLKTRNWVIGILIGARIASFFVGYLYVAEILTEPANPIIHTFQVCFVCGYKTEMCKIKFNNKI